MGYLRRRTRKNERGDRETGKEEYKGKKEEKVKIRNEKGFKHSTPRH
jgi:hypothetical protein